MPIKRLFSFQNFLYYVKIYVERSDETTLLGKYDAQETVSQHVLRVNKLLL